MKKICPTLYKTAAMTKTGTIKANGGRVSVYDCAACGSHHTTTQILEAKKRLKNEI